MKCPGLDCAASVPEGGIACAACLERIHPAIRARLDKLYLTARGSPAHVTLVASIARLLKEGIP